MQYFLQKNLIFQDKNRKNVIWADFAANFFKILCYSLVIFVILVYSPNIRDRAVSKKTKEQKKE